MASGVLHSAGMNDFRHAVRTLGRNRSFTLVAVATLALGIGVNTAIFSLVNAVLLHPLPVQNRDRLVFLYENDRGEGRDRNVVAPANLADFRQRNRVFTKLVPFIWFDSVGSNLGVPGRPERVGSAMISPDLFPTLGVKAVRGRLFTAADRRAPVALISYRLWKNRLAGRSVGFTLPVDGRSTTVVGVVQDGIRFPGDSDLWLPLPEFSENPTIRGTHFLSVLGLLRPGVSLPRAQAEMSAIARELEREHPDTNARRGVTLAPFEEVLVGNAGTALWILLAAVGVVLLLACLNLAHLTLAAAAARHRDLAVRAALGASGFRLLRQMLVEGLVISLAGGAFGLLLSAWITELVLWLAAGRIPRLEAGVPLDLRVLGFTLLTCCGSTLVFALAPALRAARARPADALRRSGRVAGLAGGARFRAALVASEVALSIVVLAGAGLLLESLRRAVAIQPGFQPDSVITFKVSPDRTRYRDDRALAAFADRVLERIAGLPGVSSAGAVTQLPVADEGLRSDSMWIENQPDPPRNPPEVGYRVATPGYFQTMRIPLLAGRGLLPADRRETRAVVVINQAMARRFWPAVSPLGRRIRFEDKQWRTVVGIVGDVAYSGVEGVPRAEVYVPHTQAYFDYGESAMNFVVRAKGEPGPLFAALPGAVAAADPEQPIYAVSTMTEHIGGALAPRRLWALLLGSFAALSLLLAAVGVYGTMAYSVEQRAAEAGIRVTLGAQPSQVLSALVRPGVVAVALGLTAGLGGARIATGLLAGLLYGTTPGDPLAYGAAAAVLAPVALAACWLPARRILRRDPLSALRAE